MLPLKNITPSLQICQTCHCATGIACLNDTGECNDSSCTADFCPQQCAIGWKGSNCQGKTTGIPDLNDNAKFRHQNEKVFF